MGSTSRSPQPPEASSIHDYVCSWTPETTSRLLMIEGDNDRRRDDGDFLEHQSSSSSSSSSSTGWHILDNVMTKRTATSTKTGDTTRDGVNSDEDGTPSFSHCLYQELESSKMLQKLQPSRTQGDRRVDEIMDILNSARLPLGNVQSPQRVGTNCDDQPTESTQTGKIDSVGIDGHNIMIRGDKSLFVAREYREEHETEFATKHPYLHCLVETVSSRIRSAFCTSNGEELADNNTSDHNEYTEWLDVDMSLTSVQVAVYPGDGVSGYVRHCDRGQDYCQQQQLQQQQHETQYSDRRKGGQPQRLITAIYYLTPEDWSATWDGGALRVFDSKNYHPEEDRYTDIIPYSNRMVVFRSDVVQHQVMPSLRRPRTAITMWFYGQVRFKAKSLISSESPQLNEISVDTNRSISGRPFESQSPMQLPSPLPFVVYDKQNYDIKQQHHQQQPDHPTIFVSIASYRDSETRPTIDSLFENALHPHRIFVGVVLQLMTKEEGSNEMGALHYDEQIWQGVVANPSLSTSNSIHWKAHQLRYIRLDARDATGPCFARGLCQTLYRGEDYAMQIDSHMRFRKNWDEYLIQTFRDCCRKREQDGIQYHDRVILTTYPVGYTLPNNIPPEIRGTYLVPWKFDSHGMLRQRGRLLSVGSVTSIGEHYSGMIKTDVAVGGLPFTKCFRQHLYAGGFNFGAAHAVMNEVPYDTMGLQYLFFGEELSMAVRFYTHGYDLYAPEQTVCYHLWSRHHRPTTVTDGRRLEGLNKQRQDSIAEASRAKVQQQLLGEKSTIGIPYGLGNNRPASGFAEHLGVNFADQTFVQQGGRWEDGDLSPGDFAAVGNSESLIDYVPGSVEARVASLDSNSKQLIGAFLQGIRLID